jgi:hypothetical protein
VTTPPCRVTAPRHRPLRVTIIGSVAALGVFGVGLILVAVAMINDLRHFDATISSYSTPGDDSMNGPMTAFITQTTEQVSLAFVVITLVLLSFGIIWVLLDAVAARIAMLCLAVMGVLCNGLIGANTTSDVPLLLVIGTWVAFAGSAASVGFLIANEVAASRLRTTQSMVQAPHQRWSA